MGVLRPPAYYTNPVHPFDRRPHIEHEWRELQRRRRKAQPQGGRPVFARPRAIHRRHYLSAHARSRVRAQPGRACPAGWSPYPGRFPRIGLYGQGHGGSAADPGRVAAAWLPGIRAAAAGRRQDSPCRRIGRILRRRHPCGSRGYRGARHGRVRRTARCCRHAGSGQARRRASARHRQAQHLSGSGLRRTSRACRPLRPGESQPRVAHGTPGHGADRMPRLCGAMGLADEPAHSARRHPVSPCGAHRACPGSANPGNPDSRDLARCGRRLRLQGDFGRRGNLPVLACHAVWPSGAVAGGPARMQIAESITT